jgi:hypothetical protein
MVRNCLICNTRKAALKRPKTGEMICKECFFCVFETEIHNTIINNKLFRRGEKVAIAASGGKGKALRLSLNSRWRKRKECIVFRASCCFMFFTIQ